MTSSVERLIEIAGPSLGRAELRLTIELSERLGAASGALSDLLQRRNGFYAFESALHVFPAASSRDHIGLDEWNSEHCWRNAFEGLENDGVFFAEDVFGSQFALTQTGISSFDPETGDYEHVADDVELWARAILADHQLLTAYPLARAWQAANGPLTPGRRLAPKVPFVLGGAYSVDNLADMDAVQAMRFRGSIAAQIRELPDGSNIRIDLIE